MFNKILSILKAGGISGGIIADLGCGTGEISIRLAGAGYDMLSVDCSADMLSVFREKISASPIGETAADRIQLLQQDIAALDLYGTIQGAVSTYDTLNHLSPAQLRAAFGRISLFLESGGLFIFDANTPYKHRQILAGEEFFLEDGEGTVCHWQNTYDRQADAVRIQLRLQQGGKEVFQESFLEYTYALDFWQDVISQNGMQMMDTCDGETFAPLKQSSHRFLITAKKI